MLSVLNTHTEQRDTKNLLEVMDMLIILITVVVTWVCAYVQTHQNEICAII